MLAKKKREERAKLVADARAIYETADKENRAPTADETAKFDEIMGDDGPVAKLKAEIDRLENLEKIETELGKPVASRVGREAPADPDDAEKAKAAANEKKAFLSWARGGMANVPKDLRELAESKSGHVIQNAAQSVQDGQAGGYLVPEGFYNGIIEAELAYGAMLTPGLCNSFNTGTGNPLPIVTDNDASNEGGLVDENVTVGQQTVPFGRVMLNGPTFTSKIILVPNALLQDSAYDLDAYLRKKMGMRLGRAKNRQFTLGDGANKPMGVVSAATNYGNTATAVVVAPDDLIELEHSVDPAYRVGANYMFHDKTLKNLKKKKDGQGRYIWLPGFATKEPDTINGYPYMINQHMADDGTTGNKAVLFGQFQNYFIRNVGGIIVMRLIERFADANQTAFVAFERADGNLVDAGTHPIKYLTIG